jgi:hypothetical protein
MVLQQRLWSLCGADNNIIDIHNKHLDQQAGVHHIQLSSTTTTDRKQQ